MAFQLKPLPYAENALEPHMSARTLQFHYGKHHKTYVDKLNELVVNTPLEKKTLYDLVRDLAGQRGARPKKIFNNAGQVWNHEFFWESMAPNGGGGQPSGEIAHLIETSFGGYEAFKDLFKKTAVDQFGSGWVWLTAEGDRLQVVSTANAMSPMAEGKVTLIGCDVWSISAAAETRRMHMLGWALVFLVVALIAGLLGFTGLSVASAGIAQVLFYIFVVLFVISSLIYLIRGRAPPTV